jgi:hypothetical protein
MWLHGFVVIARDKAMPPSGVTERWAVIPAFLDIFRLLALIFPFLIPFI